jgi:DNA-binding transcriptional LysR family regulator
MMSDILTPVLISFQAKHPEVRVRFRTGERVFRLEYGEAHVAVRAGRMPDEPDNVVQQFLTQGMALVAAVPYVAKYGVPAGVDDFKDHYFVGHDNDNSRAPFAEWMRDNVPSDRVVYLASENRHMRDAVLAGAGIGFVQRHLLHRDLGLTEVIPPQEEWETNLWLVTHVDLHRTAKVQAFLRYLKDEVKGMSCT